MYILFASGLFLPSSKVRHNLPPIIDKLLYNIGTDQVYVREYTRSNTTTKAWYRLHEFRPPAYLNLVDEKRGVCSADPFRPLEGPTALSR